MNPILLDFPEEFETARLTIRAPRAGDGAEVHAAIVESADRLRVWVSWANPLLTGEEEEVIARQNRAKFLTREAMRLLLFLKGTGTLVGVSALHHIEWKVPKVEIGYFVRTRFEGQGYITEAVEGITRFAFDRLGARRVEIRADPQNERSWRVAERVGFTFEGIHRNDFRNGEGRLFDTEVYSKIQMDP